MITLTVIAFNGQPGDGSLSAGFDELGGTIGRAETNQLVLPDPERAISRVHAQIAYRSGRYAVLDQGSNPVLVNGRPLGQGKESFISVGDQVQIGGYLIEVRAGSSAARSVEDPFADLLGPGAASGPGQSAASAALFDPLLKSPPAAPPAPARSVATSTAADPFASLVHSGPSAAPRPSAPPLNIPDDWDPFAPATSVPAASRGPAQGGTPAGRGARDLGLDLGAAGPAPLLPDLARDPGGADASLDALFGLSAGAVGDPLANSMLDAPLAQPNMAAAANPMQALNSAPKASADTLADQLSDLQRPFESRIAAAPVVAQAHAAPAQRPGPGVNATVANKSSAVVLSWDEASPPAGATPTPVGDAERVVPPPGSPAPAQVPEQAPFARAAGAPAVAPASAPMQVSAPSAAPSLQGESQAALLSALREGLGVPTLQLDALTPELMRLIGELLHEATRGAVDLLIARAALKREVRAEATMIVARENNPLKFSPSVEAALGHLLAPPTRGFMAAGPAMRDAFDDLRAHQIGFLAGMRAALEGLLESFDPAMLEGRLEKSSGLKALLAGSRQARSWEMFTQRYAELRAEAQDDFHSLFGKAFLKAYEQHIDQLKADGR